MEIFASGVFRSAFEVPRNSSNEYAPRSAPSEIAENSSRLECGSAKVAEECPAKFLAAAPAARRSISCANRLFDGV